MRRFSPNIFFKCRAQKLVRVLLLIGLLQGQVVLAQAPLNPKVQSFDSFLAVQIQHLKDFMKNFTEENLARIEGDKILLTETYSTRHFYTIRLQQKIENQEITETLFFTADGKPTGRIEFRRVGLNLKPVTIQDIKNGSFPSTAGCSEYSLIMDPLGYRASKRRTADHEYGHFELGSGAIQINIDSQQKTDESIVRTEVVYKAERGILEARMIRSNSEWRPEFRIFSGTVPRDAGEFSKEYTQNIFNLIMALSKNPDLLAISFKGEVGSQVIILN